MAAALGLTSQSDSDEGVFSEDLLVEYARALAKTPFTPPEMRVAEELAKLDYSAFGREIRYKQDLAVWRDKASLFRADFFHASAYSKSSVKMFLVENGRTRPFHYKPSLFNFGNLKPPAPDSKTGFGGFRLHAPINKATTFDEFVVFQGASYFRAVAQGQNYGVSARGLAISTGQPPGEEFPFFHSFWLVLPGPNDTGVTVHALLDSESVTGAYKFTLTPGQTTCTDVVCTLFPRKTISYVGIAPLTSMYLYGPNERRRFDDFRPQVHDSDGLCIWNGAGEWIWRPLVNSERLQFSAFSDHNPKGFGLLQRNRSSSEYQDFDGRHNDRPSVWVEPLGDWGEGTIDLLELPTAEEVNDNIVAFWRPKNGLTTNEGRPYHYRYRLHWCWTPPIQSNLAWVSSMRMGKSASQGARLIVTELMGTECYEGTQLSVDLRASSGKIDKDKIVLMRNSDTRGHRLAFDFIPASGDADIRGVLLSNGKPASEVWTFRWTA